MSAKWRRERALQAVAATEQEAGNWEGQGGELDLMYPPGFPGPKEIRMVDASNAVTFNTEARGVGIIKDYVDWEVGGQPGATKNVGSTGVVDPHTVDQHNFYGEMAIVRRQPDVNRAGPVGTADHNSLLAQLWLMQQTSQFYPQEAAQVDLIRAV